MAEAQTHHEARIDPSETMPSERVLCQRIQSEYQEMPGLRLTVAQASRLFNLQVSRCSEVLEALVREGVLWTNGREFFATNVGRHCN